MDSHLYSSSGSFVTLTWAKYSHNCFSSKCFHIYNYMDLLMWHDRHLSWYLSWPDASVIVTTVFITVTICHHCLSVSPFCFGHCVMCPSHTYVLDRQFNGRQKRVNYLHITQKSYIRAGQTIQWPTEKS
jgi:hypothetical protein